LREFAGMGVGCSMQEKLIHLDFVNKQPRSMSRAGLAGGNKAVVLHENFHVANLLLFVVLREFKRDEPVLLTFSGT